MTREEAIHILDNLKPTNVKSSFDAYVVGKAITMAIKALEQEPKTDTLDKIRAEIAILDDADYDYEGYYKAITDVLQIIDKYKAESEVKPNE